MLNFEILSPSEIRILNEYLNTGDSYREIGDRLGLKEVTVLTNLSRIRKTLKTPNKYALLIDYWNPQRVQRTIKDHRLTQMEQKVLGELVTKGSSSKEIANEIFITELTVKTYLDRIRKKCGAERTAQLIARYWRKQREKKSNQTL